jgi:hypothetical protein
MSHLNNAKLVELMEETLNEACDGDLWTVQRDNWEILPARPITVATAQNMRESINILK